MQPRECSSMCNLTGWDTHTYSIGNVVQPIHLTCMALETHPDTRKHANPIQKGLLVQQGLEPVNNNPINAFMQIHEIFAAFTSVSSN